MRVASRIVGILLALAGLGFLVVFVLLITAGFNHKSVLDLSPDRTTWIAGTFVLVMSSGLMLGGWYFFKLDLEALHEPLESPPSRFAAYFLARRHSRGVLLKVIALAGFVISLIRLG